MSWTLKEVGRHWDETEDYDEINKKTYSYGRRFVDGFRLGGLKNNAYVLDVCCRTGNGTLYFAERMLLKAVCMDVSEKMLKIAERRLKDAGVDFKIKKFHSLPFPLKEDEFDAVLCFETLEHMPDPDRFLQEVARVLKKNGRLILTTPNVAWEPIHKFAAAIKIHHSEGPHQFLRRKDIIQMLHKHGFSIEYEETNVLIAYGPRFLTRLGEFLEKALKNNLMRYLGLRRVFICIRK